MEFIMRNIIFLVMIIMFFINCKDDKEENSNPVASDWQTIFSLHFDAGRRGGIMNMDVTFMTNDLSEIPAVTINDTNITEFVLGQGSIQGELKNIEYSETYNYSISAGGKTTAGSITMPSLPDSVRCNGIYLTTNGSIIIPSSDSYEFAYTCSSYDYFICELNIQNDNDDMEEITSNTTVSFTPGEDHNPVEFRIKSVSGARFNSGVKPNVSGDYGDGYVDAQSVRSEYSLEIVPN
jgi:hypothetical protein